MYNLYNMIIKDERDVKASIEERREVAPKTEVEMEEDENSRFQEFLL